ncbi:MAG: peroxide stress protein YaaA, partial [Azospira sp.]|nr:peroxide stress protein YaaA [Azospira sp.]
MILILSPAKRLDYETPPASAQFTQPRLLDQSALLIKRLRELSPAEIASLMSLSDPLAALNHARYADWRLPFSPADARQAAFAFAGDVYEGLDAATLPASGLDWLQAHVRIL